MDSLTLASGKDESDSLSVYSLDSMTLDEILNDISSQIEVALGKDGKGWHGLTVGGASRLHGVLLGLRHWESDIRNDKGVLAVLEKNEKLAFHHLATATRSFLTEIHRLLHQTQG